MGEGGGRGQQYSLTREGKAWCAANLGRAAPQKEEQPGRAVAGNGEESAPQQPRESSTESGSSADSEAGSEESELEVEVDAEEPPLPAAPPVPVTAQRASSAGVKRPRPEPEEPAAGAAAAAAAAAAPCTALAVTHSGQPGMGPVLTMLQALRLEQYAAAFDEGGYDDLDYMMQLGEAGLTKLCAEVKMKPGHANKFLDFLPKYRA